MRSWLFVVLLALTVSVHSAFGATVIDEAGRSVEVKKPFTRIISLYPAHTENLFSLGLDREIIGVSRSEDFPKAALAKPVFDYREDPERFLAAHPDLVLIRPMIERSYPDLVEKLTRAGITVVSLQPGDMDETFAYWRKLGLLTGRQAAAEGMVRSFQAELAKIRGIAATIPAGARQRVYFESIHSKMKTFTPTSMAVFALTSAGGINVAGDAEQVRTTNIAAYGKERILARGAEIDVFLAQDGAMNRIDRATIVNEPGFGAIKAVRQGRVHLIDEQLVSRPTLRLLEGIRQIGRILYPAFFAGAK
ncbi:MAG: ABC transporter substrate-binding protein [Desulfobulbaceae bacterium]|nr:ABC transporter substrate-binding protein [Desulfobulbaceae bacterium]